MPGSSRSLLRDLSHVFQYWNSGFENDQSIKTSQLFKTIRAFLDTHNTLQTIKQSTNIHKELYDFYETNIQPESQLSREILFLEILTELSPVLSLEEVKLWLKTYLRPAVDSANFDIEFVQKCRELLDKFFDYEGSDDPLLVERRQEIAIMVLKYILDLYILKYDSVFKFMGLGLTEEERSTQVHFERLRFIKSNACKSLYNFALTHPVTFGTVINDRFVKVDDRLDILTLLAKVLNSKSSKLHGLADTPLFENLFKCLSFDFDEKILSSALTVLVMFVPLVSDRISAYVSDLMVIYTRIVGWYSSASTIPHRIRKLKELFGRQDKWWNIAVNSKTETPETFTVDYRPVLDAGHLLTIIYGLFPCSLVTFADSPIEYFKNHPPVFFDQSHLILIENMMNQEVSPVDVSQINVLEKATKDYIKGLRIHPNFLKPERNSIEYEVKNPTRWLVEDKDNDSLGVEEIMIGCLSLNFSFGFFIPDDIDSNSFDIKSEDSSKRNSYSSGSNTAFSNKVESRNSSIGSPLHMSAANSQFPPNLAQSVFSRKLSIAPTNLVIDNKKHSDITFKDVDYEQESSPLTNKILSDVNLSNVSTRKGSDPIHELFSNHEKLFHSSDASSIDTLQPSKSNDVYSLLGNRINSGRPQSSVASIDSTKETVFSIGTSVSETKKVTGSPLDFYHRELLLMKNEFEFSSYMKHLNKFQYIKLKLRMNKILKDHAAETNKQNELLRRNMNGTLNSSDFGSFSQQITSLKEERDKLIEKFLQLQKQASSIEQQLKSYETENQQLRTQVDEFVKKAIPNKNEEIFNLDNKLKDVTSDYSLLQKKFEDLQLHPQTATATSIEEPHVVSDNEKEIFHLKTEISMTLEKNASLTKRIAELETELKDTIRTSKAQVSSNKNDVAYQLGVLTNQYERKIQELSTTVMKYETLVEDKNLRIAQLSTSRPISIPGSINMGSEHRSSHSNSQSHSIPFSTQPHHSQTNQQNPMEIYETNRNNSSSSNESLNNPQFPYNTPPLHTPVPMGQKFPSTGSQGVPIIKGRGGYQKRSKKHM